VAALGNVVMNVVMNSVSIKFGEFLDQVRNC
jgi:hypothetical protein